MKTSILIEVLGYVLTPLSALIGWVAGSRKRKNDFIADMQASIDLLVEKNKSLIEEVIELRKENMQLRSEIAELNRKLDNVKTITKKI